MSDIVKLYSMSLNRNVASPIPPPPPPAPSRLAGVDSARVEWAFEM